MTNDNRYDVSSLTEVQFEPGSNDRVLKNRLGIMSPEPMDMLEAQSLQQTMDNAIRQFSETHRFTAADICGLHRTWLGEIYDWAGNYRQVNISKGAFPFAAAAQVPTLMAQYERDVLASYTPCVFPDHTSLVAALAITHVELVLVHPFREGNGRIARVLSVLMALQARLPLLNFVSITGSKRQDYFAAVQAGLDRNYSPMERLFAEIIEQSL